MVFFYFWAICFVFFKLQETLHEEFLHICFICLNWIRIRIEKNSWIRISIEKNSWIWILKKINADPQPWSQPSGPWWFHAPNWLCLHFYAPKTGIYISIFILRTHAPYMPQERASISTEEGWFSSTQPTLARAHLPHHTPFYTINTKMPAVEKNTR